MTVITTQRLILRPWDEVDAPALFPLASDPAVGPAAGWPAHASEEESLGVIRDVLRVPGSFAVCLRDAGPAGEPAGTLVGAMALKDADASAYVTGADERELGYWIGRPFWGRGYAPEAARALMDHARRTLGIRTVWLGYYVGNRKSARVQDKLGFRYVRTERGVAVPLLGEVRDEVRNILAEDNKIQQVIKLVGEDVLPDDQRLVAFTAFLIKNGYLQQNSFTADSYSPPIKGFEILSVILDFYHKALDLVHKDIPISLIREDESVDAITHLRELPPEDENGFERVRGRIMEHLDRVAAERTKKLRSE